MLPCSKELTLVSKFPSISLRSQQCHGYMHNENMSRPPTRVPQQQRAICRIDHSLHSRLMWPSTPPCSTPLPTRRNLPGRHGVWAFPGQACQDPPLQTKQITSEPNCQGYATIIITYKVRQSGPQLHNPCQLSHQARTANLPDQGLRVLVQVAHHTVRRLCAP